MDSPWDGSDSQFGLRRAFAALIASKKTGVHPDKVRCTSSDFELADKIGQMLVTEEQGAGPLADVKTALNMPIFWNGLHDHLVGRCNLTVTGALEGKLDTNTLDLRDMFAAAEEDRMWGIGLSYIAKKPETVNNG